MHQSIYDPDSNNTIDSLHNSCDNINWNERGGGRWGCMFSCSAKARCKI